MLRQRLTDDMKSALKAGQKERLGVIRLMISAMKSADMEPGSKGEIDDAGIIAVLTKMVKQRRDSITQFEAGKRMDLVAKEQAEVAVLQEYLPQALTDAEIDAAIAEAIAATGAAGPAGMGKVMGVLKAKLAGRADMTVVSGKVKAKLA